MVLVVMSVSASLGRAAIVGLGAGLGLAAVALLFFAVQHVGVDCHDLSPEECTFEHQIANEVARSQALGALGLACIATGLLVFGRRAPKAS
jgi:hypothetical protein